MTTAPSHDSATQAPARPKQDNSRRLPCRGCTRACSNYSHCNGKPWRL